MPLIVLTAAQQEAALSTMDTELRHLLEEHHIASEIIAAISHLHAKSVITLAKIESTEQDVRDWIVNDVGIERSGAGRGIISTLIAVWEMCKQRVAAEGVLRAEAKAEGRTPELPPQTVLNLRRDYQAVVGVLKDEEYPSEAYLNLKLAQLECGVMRAEVLDEVTSKLMEEEERNGGDEFEVDWSKRGMKLRRQKLHGTLPSNTEELRATFDLVKHCHALLRLRHGGRQPLHGHRPEQWDSYVRYLLGKDVWGAKVRDSAGNIVAELRWDQLLHFDLEARKWMTKMINESGHRLGDALAAIEGNNDLIVKFVTTALATANVRPTPFSSSSSSTALAHTGTTPTPAGKGLTKRAKRAVNNKRRLEDMQDEIRRLRSAPQADSRGGHQEKGSKGKKGKGKGKEHDNNSKWLALARKHRKLKSLPDGVRMCWNWNEGRACRANCPFDHICAFCASPDHPIWNCRAFKELGLQ